MKEKVDNVPLLITQDALKPIVEYLDDRNLNGSLTDIAAGLGTDESERMTKVITDNLAIIPIEGSLSYEKTFMGALCGMTSYQQLLEDVEDAISLGVKTIVFSVDSGGGEAFAMISTANSIKERMRNAGVKSIAYVDGMSASAAYGLSVIADEVIAHTDSRVGSVGVVIRLTDDSEKQKADGYKSIYITSAESKVPYEPDGTFKEDFLDDLRESVVSLHGRFVNHVAENRGLTFEQVDDTQAKVFNSDKALSLGLIDSVMDHDQFAKYLEQLEDDTQEMNLNIFSKKSAKAEAESQQATVEDIEASLEVSETPEVESLATNPQQEEIEMSELAELQAKLSEMEAASSTLEASNLELTTKLQEMQDALEASQALVAEMEGEKAQAASDAKKARLSAAVGDKEADSLFTALSALDDAAFDTVIASYEAKNQALANDPAFKEVGVDADAAGAHEELDVNEQLVADLKAKKEAAQKAV